MTAVESATMRSWALQNHAMMDLHARSARISDKVGPISWFVSVLSKSRARDPKEHGINTERDLELLTTYQFTKSCAISTPRQTGVQLKPSSRSETWLYRVLQNVAASHVAVVLALHYLGLLYRQVSQNDDALATCCWWDGTDASHEGGQDEDAADIKTVITDTARCPHCMLTGCLLVAIKVTEDRSAEDSTPLNRKMAQAAQLPLQKLYMAEMIVLARLSQHLSVVCTRVNVGNP